MASTSATRDNRARRVYRCAGDGFNQRGTERYRYVNNGARVARDGWVQRGAALARHRISRLELYASNGIALYCGSLFDTSSLPFCDMQLPAAGLRWRCVRARLTLLRARLAPRVAEGRWLGYRWNRLSGHPFKLSGRGGDEICVARRGFGGMAASGAIKRVGREGARVGTLGAAPGASYWTERHSGAPHNGAYQWRYALRGASDTWARTRRAVARRSSLARLLLSTLLLAL